MTSSIHSERADSRSGVFLSHSSSDKPFARRLAADLRRYGINVWLDEAEIMVGDSLVTKISSAVDAAQYVAVLLSRASTSSRWVQHELEIAIDRQLNGTSVIVLPMLLDNCVVPPCLRGRAYADFRDPGQYDRALQELLHRLEADTSREEPDLRRLTFAVTSGSDAVEAFAMFLEYRTDVKVKTVELQVAGLEIVELYQYLSDAIRSVDVLMLPLSLPQFSSLRIAEIIHRERRAVRTVLVSGSSFFQKHSARPLFDLWFPLFADLDEMVRLIIRELVTPLSRDLSHGALCQEITQYLTDASCFRWGHQSGRHEPPNSVSFAQYKSGIDLKDLQSMYDAYIESKSRRQPQGESKLIAALSAGSPATSDDTSRLLSQQLQSLITEVMVRTGVDGKSEPVSLLAVAAKAANCGRGLLACDALRAACACVVHPHGPVPFGAWVLELIRDQSDSVLATALAEAMQARGDKPV